MKYRTWIEKWLKNYIQTSTKARTYERYKQIAELHIIPVLGEYELADVSVITMQLFIAELLANGNHKTKHGLSANFVNLIISVLQNSLKTAYLIGLTSEYVADRIKRPQIVEKQVDCFTLAEQKKIENAVLNCKKDKMIGVILCLYMGLRIGELLALTWRDIDFSKGLLIVSKTCYDGKQGDVRVRIIDCPKTVNSRRVIPIPKQLIPIIKDMKKRSKCEYVIADENKPVFVRSYQRSFELLLVKLKIPHKGFHSLRHTFATRALECGIDVKTLSELLGHKNATITLNRYAHSLIEHKTNMMNRLGKLL